MTGFSTFHSNLKTYHVANEGTANLGAMKCVHHICINRGPGQLEPLAQYLRKAVYLQFKVNTIISVPKRHTVIFICLITARHFRAPLNHVFHYPDHDAMKITFFLWNRTHRLTEPVDVYCLTWISIRGAETEPFRWVTPNESETNN